MRARTGGGGAWDWANAMARPAVMTKRAIASMLELLALTDGVGEYVFANAETSMLFEAAAAWVVALVGWLAKIII